MPDKDGVEFIKHCRVLGQVFNVPEAEGDQFLEKIFILAQVMVADKIPIELQVRLVDLGTDTILDEYQEGTNLLANNPKVEIVTPTADKNSAQIVGFTFTGADRIRLKAGHWYSFELVSAPENNKNSSFSWLRGNGATPIPDAQVFRVCYTDQTKSSDTRVAMRKRQTFFGIKTSPAK
jgi:hypothetical protein